MSGAGGPQADKKLIDGNIGLTAVRVLFPRLTAVNLFWGGFEEAWPGLVWLSR